jgi:hypothetical protein
MLIRAAAIKPMMGSNSWDLPSGMNRIKAATISTETIAETLMAGGLVRRACSTRGDVGGGLWGLPREPDAQGHQPADDGDGGTEDHHEDAPVGLLAEQSRERCVDRPGNGNYHPVPPGKENPGPALRVAEGFGPRICCHRGGIPQFHRPQHSGIRRRSGVAYSPQDVRTHGVHKLEWATAAAPGTDTP